MQALRQNDPEKRQEEAAGKRAATLEDDRRGDHKVERPMAKHCRRASGIYDPADETTRTRKMQITTDVANAAKLIGVDELALKNDVDARRAFVRTRYGVEPTSDVRLDHFPGAFSHRDKASAYRVINAGPEIIVATRNAWR